VNSAEAPKGGCGVHRAEGPFLVRSYRQPVYQEQRMNNTLPCPTAIRLSLRTNAQNPDHHLWNNHGTWWCHLTLHTAHGRKHRVRCSLKTASVEKARQKRDVLFARLHASA
jgi:hypothetical protein